MQQCPSCGRRDVGQIQFTRVGSGVVFHYCRYCEHRWWIAEARTVGLQEVLRAATALARA